MYHDERRAGDAGQGRTLTAQEAGILRVLLGPEFQGRDALAVQVENATATPIDDHGSLRFLVSDAAPAEVARRVPVEAETEDVDGVKVHVLLHVVDGLLDELEIFREDSGTLLREVRAESLRTLR